MSLPYYIIHTVVLFHLPRPPLHINENYDIYLEVIKHLTPTGKYTYHLPER
jgi:hypothetical protein